MKKMLTAPAILFSILALLVTVASALGADQLSVTNLPGTINADPGDAILTSFTLSNTGSTDLNVSIKPITMTQGGYSFSLTGVPTVPQNFLSGTSQIVNITGTVPPNQLAGAYTGTVNATGGTAHADFTLTVNVASKPNVSSTSPSLSIIKGENGTETFTVTNTGNTNVVLSASAPTLTKEGDPSKTIPSASISVTPSPKNIAYGSLGTFTVEVSVPQSTESGTYKGNITLTYGSFQAKVPLTVTVIEPSANISVSPATVTIAERPGDSFSATFTVTNTGTMDLAGLTVTKTGLPGMNVTFNPSTFDLNAGQSRIVEVLGSIPDDIDTTQNPYTGTAEISNSQVSKSVSLELLGEVMIDFKRVDVYVNNKRERVDDGDTVDNINPGDNIRIKIELENLWPDRRKIDFDLENIDVALTVRDIDDGDDLEDDTSIDRIRADDTETVEFSFTVPYSTDEDTYDATIEVDAEDENGAEYHLEMTFTLSVERETHKIKIIEASLDRDTVDCDRTVVLNTEIINIGSKTERNVLLEVKSTPLNIRERVEGIELSDDPDDDDNTYSQVFVLTVPDSVRPGSYRINVNAYLSRTDLDDTKMLTLNVQECSAPKEEVPAEEETAPPKEEAKKEETATAPETIVVSPPTAGEVVAPPKREEAFTESTAYIVLLAVLVVLLLIAVIGMAALLFRKR